MMNGGSGPATPDGQAEATDASSGPVGGRSAVAARLEVLARLVGSAWVAADVLPELDGQLAELERVAASSPQGQRLFPAPAADEQPRFLPPYTIDFIDDEHVRGRCTFGPFYLGGSEESVRLRSVHGGAIALLFDQVLGWISLRGGKVRTRTAYLKVDFRAMATVPAELSFTGWVDRVEGRKQFIRGELRDGDTIVAEAECLYVTPQGWETPPGI